jgi:hypothetical protein
MFIYLRDNDLDKLIADLSRIENHARDKSIEEHGYNETEEKTLWFKFFSGDTGAADISNIKRDLQSATNREFMLDNFRITTEDLDPDKELQVYFS